MKKLISLYSSFTFPDSFQLISICSLCVNGLSTCECSMFVRQTSWNVYKKKKKSPTPPPPVSSHGRTISLVVGFWGVCRDWSRWGEERYQELQQQYQLLLWIWLQTESWIQLFLGPASFTSVSEEKTVEDIDEKVERNEILSVRWHREREKLFVRWN